MADRRPLPDCVQRLNLEFDCGLALCNAAVLIDTLTTKYMLLLEDDFLFADETTVEPLVDVLETDPEVGVVGSAAIVARARGRLCLGHRCLSRDDVRP